MILFIDERITGMRMPRVQPPLLIEFFVFRIPYPPPLNHCASPKHSLYKLDGSADPRLSGIMWPYLFQIRDDVIS